MVQLWLALYLLASFLALVIGPGLEAAEYPIGIPKHLGGMEIAAVYLQPIDMEPEGMMRKAADSDIHLEADIQALPNNPNGFKEGHWIPHLAVKYELTKQPGKEKVAGELMPMVANDGPHYGDNVKLSGPGKYRLKLSVFPPAHDGGKHFGRHTDRLTGVRPWFKPIEVEFEFVFVGIGKKGGY